MGRALRGGRGKRPMGELNVPYEEFTTMAAISSELNSIRQTLEARNVLDAERRKIDDERDIRLLERVDIHGQRMTAMETKWAAFFGENGAFTYVKKKIESTDLQNKWIIALVITTLVGIIVNLAVKH